MSSSLDRIGRWCARHGRRVAVGWLVVAVVIFMVARLAGGDLSDDLLIPGSETQRATDLLGAHFPAYAGGSATIVFRAEGGVAGPATAAAIEATLQRVRDLPHVVAVSDPLAPEGAEQVSQDGTIAYADVRYDESATGVGAGGLDTLTEALAPLRATGVQAEVGGEVAYVNTPDETSAAEIFGVVMAIVILLVAFGSVFAMGLPILTAIAGLAIGLAAVGLLARAVTISTSGPQVATMIGLGVGIDYALFVVTRFREFLGQGLEIDEAAGRANATAGLSVVFAGCTVVIAMLGLLLTGVAIVGSLGLAAAIVVAVAVACAVTLLPAVLGLLGRRVDRFAVRRSRPQGGDGIWERWAHRVSGRPWPWLLGGAALLLLLAAPALDLRLGVPDAGNEPRSSSQRRAYDLLAQGFGPGFNGPFLIVVDLAGDGGVSEPANAAVLDAIGQAAAADRDVASVDAAVTSPDGQIAVLTVVPRTAPQDEATQQLLHRLRADVIPPVVRAAPSGADVFVAGPTAAFDDLTARLSRGLPFFIGAVVLLSFALLTVIFRSLVVPLKAAVLNVLSVGASYGVIVAVFQWGWGLGLLGIAEPIPIISFIPILMFAILFGLSMDYEVFLLSRIREAYEGSGDNTRSVATGLAGTAGIISAAALVMISVFGAFVAGPEPLIKMLGLGMATSVLVDATIVRLVLVPATMALLGRANWWAPRWLERRLPHIEGDAGGARGPHLPSRTAPEGFPGV